jgi:hypothetical protein
LDLPPTTAIHLVTHISQLRAATGLSQAFVDTPTQLTAELALVVQPKAIMGVRKRNHDTPPVQYTYVRRKRRGDNSVI